MEATIYIKDVYHITGIGVVLVGDVKSGTLKTGMSANINGTSFPVKTIEMHHKQVQEANVSDNIGFTLKGLGKKDVIKGTEVKFSDQELPPSGNTTPEPIHPRGFLSKLFGREKK